jgi:hypothetical protein
VRWVVHVITAISLLACISGDAEARRVDPSALAQVKEMPSLPATLTTARRDDVPDVRLPTFVVPAPSIRIERLEAAAVPPTFTSRGPGWARVPTVAARGPPRG